MSKYSTADGQKRLMAESMGLPPDTYTRVIDPLRHGDYGANPCGDGTFRIMLIRLTHTALDVVVTFISHLVVFVIGIAPASSAFPGAEIRLPAAATFATDFLACFSTQCLRISFDLA